MQSQASPQTCRACNRGVAVLEWTDDEQVLRYRPLPNNFSVDPEGVHDWWIWPRVVHVAINENINQKNKNVDVYRVLS